MFCFRLTNDFYIREKITRYAGANRDRFYSLKLDGGEGEIKSQKYFTLTNRMEFILTCIIFFRLSGRFRSLLVHVNREHH